ncbi:hypothetical protein MRX96_039560 [Rhipicephalus microplus]
MTLRGQHGVFSACSLGKEPQPATGFTKCIHVAWNTPAGSITIDCSKSCQGERQENAPQCLALASGASKYYGKQGVTYKCLLGECDQRQVCNPVDLLVDCWAPEANKIKRET